MKERKKEEEGNKIKTQLALTKKKRHGEKNMITEGVTEENNNKRRRRWRASNRGRMERKRK